MGVGCEEERVGGEGEGGVAVADPVPVEEEAAARRHAGRGEDERAGARRRMGTGREVGGGESGGRAADGDGHGRQTHVSCKPK